MGYALNFNLIWRHFDKLWGGLLLSLELAIISIAIGIVIGLVLAVWYVSAGVLKKATNNRCVATFAAMPRTT